MNDNNPVQKDDSVIDITNEAVNIEPFSTTPIQSGKVPVWPHKYIFGAYEINYATPAQKQFYDDLKSAFLLGECRDIEDNSNYVFVLLFELLNEYRAHGDIHLLERQIKLLADNYAVARSYALSYLVKLIAEKETQRDPLFMEAASFVINAQKASVKMLEDRFNLSYQRAVELADQLEEAGIIGPFQDMPNRQVLMTSVFQIRPSMSEETEARLIDEFPDFYWTLSQRYSKQLALSRKQKRILDQVRISDSSFNMIEFFRLSIIRLFLTSVEKLDELYGMLNSSLSLQMNTQADLIARKHYRYRQHSRNYNSFLQSATSEQYSALFKICENEVRRHYGHKRKVQVPLYCNHSQIVDSFGQNMFERFLPVVKEECTSLPLLNETLEVELNAQNTTRWKEKFSQLTAHIKNGNDFISEIRELARLNKENPSLDLIYFEASKVIAKVDKTAALILYLYYLDTELRSEFFSYKELSKTLRKNLFRTDEQIKEFEEIIGRLIKTHNLQEAIDHVRLFYQPKRKRIHINRQHIRQVQQHHAATVNLLNKYLQEEEEEEIELSIPISEVFNNPNVGYIVNLNEIQQAVLHLFEKNNFTIPQSDLMQFAKEKGYFINQLIESINDACYEMVDDLLIEEEEECYVINEEYYNNIKTT